MKVYQMIQFQRYMMKAQTIEKLLCSIPLFEGAAPGSVGKAARSPLLYEKTYAKGEKVAFDGGALAVLVKGKLKVGGRSEIKKLTISQMASGAVFGYATLFEKDDAFEPDIRAACESTVLYLPEDLVRALIADDPAFACCVIAAQSAKIRYLNKQILSYTAPSAAEIAVAAAAKLYRFLCSLPGKEDGAVSLSAPAAQLAARLDMGRASFYRALRTLEEEGRIEKNKDKIILKGEK